MGGDPDPTTPFLTLLLLLAWVGVPPARHACSSKIFGQAMSSALISSPGNASAAAAAFMSSCAGTWSDHDLRRYHLQVCGSSCVSGLRYMISTHRTQVARPGFASGSRWH